MAIEFIAWDPGEHALNYSYYMHPTDAGQSTIIVDHQMAPFQAVFSGVTELSDSDLQKVGAHYLQRLHELLVDTVHADSRGLPVEWLDTLVDNVDNDYFGWLPLWPPDPLIPTVEQPIVSTQRIRAIAASESIATVLVATQTSKFDGARRAINADFGVQVVLHTRPRNDGKVDVLISCMTAYPPYGLYKSEANLPASSWLMADGTRIDTFDKLQTYLDLFRPRIALHLGLDENLALNSVKPVLSPENIAQGGRRIIALDIEGSGRERSRRGFQYIHQRFTLRFTLKLGRLKMRTQVLERRPLTAAAGRPQSLATQARVFHDDPATAFPPALPATHHWTLRRPRRDDDVLDQFRHDAALPEPLETNDFRVFNCPEFVKTDGDGNLTRYLVAPVTLPPGWPSVRSNDASAASAYFFSAELFETMRSLGIDPNNFIVATQRRFHVYYRSGISPGPGKDGQTINARVSLTRPAPTPPLIGGTHTVEIHTALGDLGRRARPTSTSGSMSHSEPLGIANARRWMWHEFGHALIASRFGSLELKFSHSVGDGLAAIVCDPYSTLAAPQRAKQGFRSWTFPWIHLGRRHDRRVYDGWSWSGEYQLPVYRAPEHERAGRKAYLSEQILSTTLFRLYRVLGGDTHEDEGEQPDRIVREMASRIVVFLVIRGLQYLVLSPIRAEELVLAMANADFGQNTSLPLALPRSGVTVPWTGGVAHKAIRWSFEAQGMYAPGSGIQGTIEPSSNKPGEPPEVDVFLADRRPCMERMERGFVEYGPGGYVPVSLDWHLQRLWEADARAIEFTSPWRITINVSSRGRINPGQVHIRVWLGWVYGDLSRADWALTESIHWFWEQDLGQQQVATNYVVQCRPEDDGGNAVQPNASAVSGQSHLLVLVEVSCPNDRANTDPAAMRPCAVAPWNFAALPQTPRALTNLIANDNNLGLRVVSH